MPATPGTASATSRPDASGTTANPSEFGRQVEDEAERVGRIAVPVQVDPIVGFGARVGDRPAAGTRRDHAGARAEPDRLSGLHVVGDVAPVPNVPVSIEVPVVRLMLPKDGPRVGETHEETDFARRDGLVRQHAMDVERMLPGPAQSDRCVTVERDDPAAQPRRVLATA